MGHFNTNVGKANTEQPVIRHVAGNEAISVKDLLCVAERGKIWPVESKTFGAVQKAGTNIYFNNLHQSYYTTDSENMQIISSIVDDVTRNVVLLSNTADITLSLICNLTLCDESGDIIRRVSLNGAGLFLKVLSNGNFLVVYTRSNNEYFQIYNAKLDLVAAETLIISNSILDVLPLSGGGFAIFAIANSSTNVTFRTYTNVGASPTTAIVILPSPTTKLIAIELSNGDIGICCAYTTGDVKARVGVINLAGAFVSPFTAVGLGVTILAIDPSVRLSMSVVNGFFCCMTELGNRTCVAVYTNAGVLKNYNNTFIPTHRFTPDSYPTCRRALLVNDGQAFWALIVVDYLSGSRYVGDSLTILYLPTTGLNSDNKLHELGYRSTFKFPDAYYLSDANNIGLAGSNLLNMDIGGFYTRNTIVIAWKSSVVVLDVDNGFINSVNTVEHDTYTYPSTDNSRWTKWPASKDGFTNVGDGCYFWFHTGEDVWHNTMQHALYGVRKYLDTPIVGVSKTDVAVNHEDTPIDFVTGVGVIAINPIPGAMNSFVSDEGASNISETMYYNVTTNELVSSATANKAVTTAAGKMSRGKYKSGTIFNNSVLFTS